MLTPPLLHNFSFISLMKMKTNQSTKLETLTSATGADPSRPREPEVLNDSGVGGGASRGGSEAREHERARRGGGDDTAGTIFCDQSILTLLLPPIITSASEFPGGKSKTSGAGMSWECAVQWKMGWRLPGRVSSMLKSTFMLMNQQSAWSFFTVDLLLTAPKTHH